VKLLKLKPFSYYWLVAQVERWTIPRTDGVLCITHYTEDLVRPRARRTWVLPNPVDPSFFSLKNTPLDVPEIICVAYIQERKNQIRLLEGLDPVAKQTRFKMVFYGTAAEGDPYGAKFMAMLKERPWCEYRGFADRKTLKAALERATALVLPSIEENCPMSVLESMAAGVPVAASRAGGIPDLFEDGVSGLFFDPHDPKSIGSAIQRLLTDRALAGRLAVQARDRALQKFHPEVIAKGHLEIYRDLLNSGRAQRAQGRAELARTA
jgi:glycosyltransferase involved in cell wall biosynthesis